jgi:hypothetical protein
MKRLLEADIELSDESKALLDKVTDRYVNAMTMANRFLSHIRKLYDNEAMYMDADSCFMHLLVPHLTFNWVNVGLKEDKWMIVGSTSGLHAFFDFIGQDGKIWHLSAADHAHCHELLTDYFVKNPLALLVIETWGEGGYHRGGSIGQATGFEWIEEEEEDDSEENGSDDDEAIATIINKGQGTVEEDNQPEVAFPWTIEDFYPQTVKE